MGLLRFVASNLRYLVDSQLARLTADRQPATSSAWNLDAIARQERRPAADGLALVQCAASTAPGQSSRLGDILRIDLA